MEKEPFDDLTPAMRARLEKWRANVLKVKSADTIREKSPGNYVPRKKDYGDDMSEFEPKAGEKK
jgi:hypothetical protein